MLEPELKGPILLPPLNGPMFEPLFIGPQLPMLLGLPQPLLLPVLPPKKADADTEATTVAIATIFVAFFILSPLRVYLII
jgi:hypothetical protein